MRRPCPAPGLSLSSAPVTGHIVTIGGGTFLTDDPDPRLDAWAADDHAALHFAGGELAAKGYRVEPGSETGLGTRLL